MRNVPKAYLLAISATMLWSTAAVAFKIALVSLDFIQLLFISSFISSIILTGILVIRGKFHLLLQYSRRQYLNSMFLGLLNPFGYYMVLLKAYSILPAQLAQPLNYTWPVMLVLLSAPLLKQKLHKKSMFAILISFLGVFIISLRDNITGVHIDQPFGIVLATSSSVFWALFWIFNVKDTRTEIEKLALGFLFSLIYTSLAMLLFSEFKIPNLKAFLAATYVGFFEMGFTFIIWLMALQLAGRSDKISNFVFISPFFSLIWIHLILNESIYKTTIFGLILIISGIIIQQFKKSESHKNTFDK